jgi:adenylate cyclase
MGDKSADKTEELENILSIYQQGLDYYLEKDWDKAINQFKKVLTKKPDDGPSKTYIERCQKFKKEPPGDDWDGVFHLKTK